MPLDRMLARRPWVPYVVPFAAFMLLLGALPSVGLSPRADAVVRCGLLVIVIAAVARPALDFRVTRPLGTVAVGVGVFVIWIAPDLLIPGYRDMVAFQNSLTGTVESSIPPEARSDPVVVMLRFFRAAMIVPIVEELFWRGWLPRWLDQPDNFLARPLGTFSRWAFWSTAILFALEHGPYWEVGLIAGLIYNWWMERTRRLGDLIACHAVTNGCLGAYVLLAGKWEYW